MGDHLGNSAIAEQRGAMRTEAVAPATASLQQVQGDRSLQQSMCLLLGQGKARRELRRSLRIPGQSLEELQLHAGQQNLGIDEAGTEIEESRRPALCDRPCQRKGGSPALET